MLFIVCKSFPLKGFHLLFSKQGFVSHLYFLRSILTVWMLSLALQRTFSMHVLFGFHSVKMHALSYITALMQCTSNVEQKVGLTNGWGWATRQLTQRSSLQCLLSPYVCAKMSQYFHWQAPLLHHLHPWLYRKTVYMQRNISRPQYQISRDHFHVSR